jgi:hypothetical protein
VEVYRGGRRGEGQGATRPVFEGGYYQPPSFYLVFELHAPGLYVGGMEQITDKGLIRCCFSQDAYLVSRNIATHPLK